MKKLIKKWWFWLALITIISTIVVGISLPILMKDKIIANLNEEVTIGKLTYYIQDDWINNETVEGNSRYKYYYPTNDTMLMITINSNKDYQNYKDMNTFLDGYISGLNLDSNDFIERKIKRMSGYNYGIVRFYTNSNSDKYETVSYVILNGQELYVLCLSQKNKIKKDFENIINEFILKVKIQQETEKERQDRLEKERIEQEQKEAEEKAKEEQRKAEEKARKEQEEKDFKESCNTYTYEQMARNPEKFKGTNVKLTGEVIQALYDTSSVDLRVNITKQGKYSTYYTDTVYVTYYPSNEEDKILEDDIITIYGTSQGDYTYTSTIGAKVTLPLIYAKYIQIQK